MVERKKKVTRRKKTRKSPAAKAPAGSEKPVEPQNKLPVETEVPKDASSQVKAETAEAAAQPERPSEAIKHPPNESDTATDTPVDTPAKTEEVTTEPAIQPAVSSETAEQPANEPADTTDMPTDVSAGGEMEDSGAETDSPLQPAMQIEPPSEDIVATQPAIDTKETEEIAAEETAEISYTGPEPTEAAITDSEPVLKHSRSRIFSLVQLVLIISILISAGLLSYSIFHSPPVQRVPYPVYAEQEFPATADANRLATEQGNQDRHIIEPSSSDVVQTEAVSLQTTESYYAGGDYEAACRSYERLYLNLYGGDFELMKDFLKLRMALCLEKQMKLDRAGKLFREAAKSSSVVVRTLANFHCSLLELESGQYLKARTNAYKTIALTGVLTTEHEWALELERDCLFVVAEALTRQVLSLCDADSELPDQLWFHPTDEDPLAGLNETELTALLNSGIERLNSGLLAPQVSSAERTGTLSRWSVVCNGPSIEELMARFAANSGIDVKWAWQSEGTSGAGQQSHLRNRSVTVYLTAATTEQIVTTTAGTVGLLALIDEAGTVIVTDPTEYSSLSEHTRMLSEHAIWLWRNWLLIYNDDPRVTNAHFALGVLQASRGQVVEAIAEYKLVANRYSQTPLAPCALLRSSRLKSALRNYTGAGSDLQQLIEQYPDNELIGQAHLDLADTTMKLEVYDDACSLYKKAHSLGFSAEIRAAAAFGAGKCFYQTKDYKSAAEWIARYLQSVRQQQMSQPAEAELYTAYLLLGRANLALGKTQQACEALDIAARKAASSSQCIDAVSALVEAQLKQDDFVAALGAIENIRSWPFSQEQVTTLLLLKSKTLRAIGLAEDATTVLAERAQYLTEPHLRASIILELARCEIAIQNHVGARAHLTEVLSLVEPGPIAHQVSLELAGVCLKLNDIQQAISICTKLMESSASTQIKEQASRTLAAAYSKQQNYDKAALALLMASNRSDTTEK